MKMYQFLQNYKEQHFKIALSFQFINLLKNIFKN